MVNSLIKDGKDSELALFMFKPLAERIASEDFTFTPNVKIFYAFAVDF